MSARPRILFLDAYDSFTNNITSLLTTLLAADVYVLHIDSPLLDPTSPAFPATLHHELSHYTAVVCGPGPGTAADPASVGLMRHIWALPDAALLPVLGVCLGFQSLVHSAPGATVRRLQRGLHGMVRPIAHDAADAPGNIFAGVPPFSATLYHSLCADIGQDAIDDAAWEDTPACWQPSRACPDMVPLAWTVTEPREPRILMAARHVAKPFWALQYHPESVCTQDASHAVIRNWFREAVRWNEGKGRVPVQVPAAQLLASNARKESLLQSLRLPSPATNGQVVGRTRAEQLLSWLELDGAVYMCSSITDIATETLPKLNAPNILEALGLTPQGPNDNAENIIFDSSNSILPPPPPHIADNRGRYSIIALDVSHALRVEYTVGSSFVTILPPVSVSVGGDGSGLTPRNRIIVPLDPYTDIWQFLSHFLSHRQNTTMFHEAANSGKTPFEGGFMGYVTYEMGLEGIGVESIGPKAKSAAKRPDLCFVWVTRSIVVDHRQGIVHVQALEPVNSDSTSQWVEQTSRRLKDSDLFQSQPRTNGHQQTQNLSTKKSPDSSAITINSIQEPGAETYQARVKSCQEYIAAGDSYELCLTGQTTIKLSRTPSPSPTPTSWTLYRTLRQRQPAPYASYLRIGGATLVSASPELFVEHSRDGMCSMRPMKGTVRKATAHTAGAARTLEEAEKLLHTDKERAENLMIVDLVRHDLHGICGAGQVSVPRLMAVEEYASVFQMITLVQGQLPPQRSASGEDTHPYTGLDVLAASLPPGSMTGAPKKRSCELLQTLEADHCTRSLYSGVVGYLGVRGQGAWSVTIRSLFRWDDECSGDDEVWRVGAGGAVTALSTPEGEWDEMLAKLAVPLSMLKEAPFTNP